MRRQWLFSTCAVTLLGMSTIGSAEEPVEIRFAVEYSADILPGQANRAFADRIDELSDGRITVDYLPDGSLYSGQDLLLANLRGDVDMTTLVSIYWTGISEKLGVLELPFAFPTHESFYAAVDDPNFLTDIFSEVEGNGAVVLGALPYSYVYPGSASGPMRTPEEFNGESLRAIGQMNRSTLSSFGADPNSINITELAGAIQQGVVDGLNTPLDAWQAYSFYEDIQDITLLDYQFVFYPWTVNADWWESLSDTDQRLIQEAVDDVTNNYRAIAREQIQDSKEYLERQGVKFHEPTPSQKSKFRAAVEPQWESFRRNVSAEAVELIEQFSNN